MELYSPGGRLNLAGGTLLVCFSAAIVLESMFSRAGRFLLQWTGHTAEPATLGAFELIIVIAMIPVYFLGSLWMTIKNMRK